MSGERCIFTICDQAYFDRALVLARSVAQFEIDVPFFVICLGEQPGAEVRTLLLSAGAQVLHPEKVLDGTPWRKPADSHTIVELATAIKFPVALSLLRAYDQAIYLDPDMRVYGPLVEAWARIALGDVIVTPHLVSAGRLKPGGLPNEVDALRFGSYNLGFLGLNGTDATRLILDWLAIRAFNYSSEDTSLGLFTDQKWIDLGMAVFTGITAFRNGGYNVASWNLHERGLHRSGPDGLISTASHEPLVLFHFSKACSVGLDATRRSVGLGSVVAGLWSSYLSEIDLARTDLAVTASTEGELER